MTDNGANLCSELFAGLLAQRRIAHLRTRPYLPQTNGKAERFNCPSPRNSSTQGASDPKPTGAFASNVGSTTTTVTDITPQSAARPHHAPTTSAKLPPVTRSRNSSPSLEPWSDCPLSCADGERRVSRFCTFKLASGIGADRWRGPRHCRSSPVR